jgi:hypothetical protein
MTPLPSGSRIKPKPQPALAEALVYPHPPRLAPWRRVSALGEISWTVESNDPARGKRTGSSFDRAQSAIAKASPRCGRRAGIGSPIPTSCLNTARRHSRSCGGGMRPSRRKPGGAGETGRRLPAPGRPSRGRTRAGGLGAAARVASGATCPHGWGAWEWIASRRRPTSFDLFCSAGGGSWPEPEAILAAGRARCLRSTCRRSVGPNPPLVTPRRRRGSFGFEMAARITLPKFSVSSAMNSAKLARERP